MRGPSEVEAPDRADLGPGPERRPHRGLRRSRAALITLGVTIPLAVALVAVLVLRTGPSGTMREAATSPAPAPSPVPAASPAPAPPPRSETAAIVRRALPSVVFIRTTALGFDLFGQPQEARAQGSGVIIDRDGVILTNNHVVAGAVRVTVVFNDGRHRPRPGTVVGTDPEHDLAVVRVDASDLRPIPIGSSGALELGDDVVAIGFPLGLGGPSVTKGIVSGLNRSIEAGGGPLVEHLTGLIQTDAAINPGNSGGPLLDAAGRLVGITTAAASASAAENVGFAIPVDDAVPISRAILAKPAERRAWLGVQVASLTSPAEAAQLGLPLDARGAVVLAVIPGGPADRAGLRAGEVIVGVGDREIVGASDLTEALAALEPGDRPRVRVLSAAGERTVEVRLGQRPPSLAAPGG